jgi:hypothetical protein
MDGPFDLDQIILGVDALLHVQLLKQGDRCFRCTLKKQDKYLHKSIKNNNSTVCDSGALGI